LHSTAKYKHYIIICLKLNYQVCEYQQFVIHNVYTQSLGRFPKLAADVEEEEKEGDQEGRRLPNIQSDKRALESK